MEQLDDSCLLMTRKECRGLQNKVDRERKTKEDVECLHGSLEKKFAELEAKFSKLEKDNSALTSDYASLKKVKVENAGTFEIFKIQMQKEIEDLKVSLDEKVGECKKKDAEIDGIVAQASDRGKDTPPENVEEYDVAVGDKTSEVVEAPACDVLILPSEQGFTTDDLLRVAQDELVRNDDIDGASLWLVKLLVVVRPFSTFVIVSGAHIGLVGRLLGRSVPIASLPVLGPLRGFVVEPLGGVHYFPYLCKDRFLATAHKSGAMLTRGSLLDDRPQVGGHAKSGLDLRRSPPLAGVEPFAGDHYFPYLWRDRFLATAHKSGVMLSQGWIFVDRLACWRCRGSC
ncbi:hypothetical protein COLO4_38014 [Corchorus olitorius]|uniref:Uncharacterized protein n=1 Tax=Corchorus olitorius TaxID=93759 RepID=A0A1R3FXI5_9ROSI|nr:hypothetical protein COLO4_38014 [Corchorus olitorius]